MRDNDTALSDSVTISNSESQRPMLTTSDNPFDPFSNFEEWYNFDTSRGYNSLSLLARIARTSDDLTETEQEEEIVDAINEIIHYNLSGMHQKVLPEDFVKGLRKVKR